MITTFICDNCKDTITHESAHTTGYGTNKEGEKICFDCCGKHDEQILRALKIGESIHLYFTKDGLTNWPGSFKLKPYFVSTGKHNIGRTRTDAWFYFNCNRYHGVNIGDNDCMKVTRVKGDPKEAKRVSTHYRIVRALSV